MTPLLDLLKELEVDDWDVVLVGDGSGSNWERSCGWGCVSVERETGRRLVWYGFANKGSVNVAEAMAYLWPLSWVANNEMERVAAGKRRRILKVHIITDSQYCEQVGSVRPLNPKKNGLLWDSFESLRRRGIVLTWHHLKRDVVGLNKYADAVSKLVRTTCSKYNVQQELAARGGAGETVYDINPYE